MQIVNSIMSFIMLGAFFAAVAVSILVYKKTASKAALTITFYFALQILLECQIRATEATSALSRWFQSMFFSMVVVKGLTYAAIIFAMMTLVLHLLKITPRLLHYIFPAVLTVWLICVPLIEKTPGIFYWVYLMPCELFYFGLASYGLRRLNDAPGSLDVPALRRLFRAMAVFAVFILSEDIVCGIDYGFFEKGYQLAANSAPDFAKMRNYFECVMNLFFAFAALKACGRVLISSGAEAQSLAEAEAVDAPEAEAMDADAEASPVLTPLLPQAAVNKIADELSLSPREREVLPLLLARMSILLMSETLMISKGTVKSHVHNIYQKAGVSDREALILLAADFISA